MSVPLPPKIVVPFWKVAKLRSLLQVPHFAAIRILSDNTNRYLDVLVLRKMQQDLSATPTTAATIYPVLPSVLSPASAPPLERYWNTSAVVSIFGTSCWYHIFGYSSIFFWIFSNFSDFCIQYQFFTFFVRIITVCDDTRWARDDVSLELILSEYLQV